MAKPQPSRKSIPRKQPQLVVTAGDSILEKLQQLQENDLSQRILRPLFLKLGYSKVEFYGGVSEGGKDLICSRTNEIGDLTITVVQVKRYRLTAKARDVRSFSEVVTQLSQALEKPIVTLTGTIVPSAVYFVTPYALDTRALESRFEGHQSLRHRNARVIDGVQLLTLLQSKCPEVLCEFTGDVLQLNSRLVTALNNDALMRALNADATRHLKEIYTDIDLSIGSPATRRFLLGQFQPKVTDVRLDRLNWNLLIASAAAAKEHFKVSLLDVDIAQMESAYAAAQLQYSSHIQVVRELSSRREQIDGVIRQLNVRLDSMEAALEDDYAKIDEKRRSLFVPYDSASKTVQRLHETSALRSQRTDKLSTRERDLDDDLAAAVETERLAKTAYDSFLEHEYYEKGSFIEYRHALNLLRSATSDVARSDRLKVLLQKLKTLNIDKALERQGSKERLKEFAMEFCDAISAKVEVSTRFKTECDKNIPVPEFVVRLDGRNLAAFLSERKHWVVASVSQLNDANDTKLLATFLSECSDLLRGVTEVLSCEGAQVCVGMNSDRQLTHYTNAFRLRVPLHNIFETGQSLLLLGEAGAGKTTSLQMYAHRILSSRNISEHVCIFVPLARMAKAVSAIEIDQTGSQPKLLDGIAAYIRELGLDVTPNAICDLLRSRRSTLILDGVDEAIGTIPWIVPGIKEIQGALPNLQILASSRASGPYAKDLPLMPLTLLPFTNRQLRHFIRGWFGERGVTVAASIDQHLMENPDLQRVVRNPLLATVLCVLAQQGVALPNTEYRLYDQRINLLTGYYDVVKDIRTRVRTQQSDLVECAKKIAFAMHCQRVRDEEPESILASLRGVMSNRMSHDECRTALNELIDPCNVLVPMTVDGRLGFGHLRHQEHLAAEEIRTNRDIEVGKLLNDRWWRDALVLLARNLDGLSWLIRAIDPGSTTPLAATTLEAMAAVRPKEEQAELREMIAERRREFLDSMIEEDGDEIEEYNTDLVDVDDDNLEYDEQQFLRDFGTDDKLEAE